LNSINLWRSVLAIAGSSRFRRPLRRHADILDAHIHALHARGRGLTWTPFGVVFFAAGGIVEEKFSQAQAQTQARCRSREHAVALVIDELLGLRDRERDSVVAAVVRIRSDELVLF
jgi:hypothetical protein